MHTDSDGADFKLANNGAFPWHVTILIKYCYNPYSPYPAYYSGAILNEKWIIGPAKKIIKALSIRVDIGSVNIKVPTFSVYPDAYTIHPQFNEDKFENNIALLRLSGDETLDKIKASTFSPIRLPQKRQIDQSFVGLQFEAHISSYRFSKPSMYSYFCWAFFSILPFRSSIFFHFQKKKGFYYFIL